jgi:predicted nicotinamide N-methyase
MQPASKQAAALASAEAALDTLWGAASSAAPCSAGAVADALLALAEAAKSSSQAVALAKQRGAVSLLRRWLADADESVVDLAAAAVASLASQDSRAYRTYTFGEHTLRLRDASAVTGGLGWRVWRAALILCDLLRETPDLVAGRRVLEVGAGCGACGLLAGACGARETVVTDCFAGLLETLAENISLNAEPGSDETACWAPRVSAAGGGYLLARHLAWGDDNTAAADASEAPRLALEELFDVIIGSDVMYEAEHAEQLPRVLARHLAPGGYALLVCGVRFPDVLAAFLERLAHAGLQVTHATLQNRKPGGDSSSEDEDESVTMAKPPLGQLAMLIWRQGDTLPACVEPPPWTHSWL